MLEKLKRGTNQRGNLANIIEEVKKNCEFCPHIFKKTSNVFVTAQTYIWTQTQ